MEVLELWILLWTLVIGKIILPLCWNSTIGAQISQIGFSHSITYTSLVNNLEFRVNHVWCSHETPSLHSFVFYVLSDWHSTPSKYAHESMTSNYRKLTFWELLNTFKIQPLCAFFSHLWSCSFVPSLCSLFLLINVNSKSWSV
jgi:hypothetical protein